MMGKTLTGKLLNPFFEWSYIRWGHPAGTVARRYTLTKSVLEAVILFPSSSK